MRLKQKIIVTTSLSIFSLLSSFILSFKVFFIDLQLSFWLQYIGNPYYWNGTINASLGSD